MPEQVEAPARWLLRYSPPDRPVSRLVCLAGAGGSVAVYHPWAAALAPDVEVCAVLPPGRGTRWREQPMTRMAPLVDALSAALCDGGRVPLVLFGHSLGGLIAYEVALRLQDRTDVDLRAVVVAAHRAPGIGSGSVDPGRVTDEQLIRFLEVAGGTPPDLLGDDELRRMVLTALRADFALDAGYRPATDAPVTVPLHVHGGSDDSLVPYADLAAWKAYAAGEFELRTHPGGHFFFTGAGRDAIIAALRPLLAGAGSRGPRP
ncbi:thioesterase [Actinoplanes sp. NBRC 14428]|nr:thioesterase [Actinoplanes sp. NBRC 14428]